MATKRSVEQLNNDNPVNKRAGLGDKLDALVTLVNEMRASLMPLRAAFPALTLSSAGLAIGTGSKKLVKIANTVTYLIGGEFKAKTTAEVAFTATTHDIAADGAAVKEAVYVLSLNAAGTATITKGATATGAGNAAIPAGPAGQAVIGYARIAVAAGATPFDATTDDLDAAHLTVTYVNLAYDPGQVPALAAVAVPALD